MTKLRYPAWTTDEDWIITNHYRRLSRSELNKLLPGRTYNAIRTRALYLGVAQARKQRVRIPTKYSIFKNLPFPVRYVKSISHETRGDYVWRSTVTLVMSGVSITRHFSGFDRG